MFFLPFFFVKDIWEVWVLYTCSLIFLAIILYKYCFIFSCCQCVNFFKRENILFKMYLCPCKQLEVLPWFFIFVLSLSTISIDLDHVIVFLCQLWLVKVKVRKRSWSFKERSRLFKRERSNLYLCCHWILVVSQIHFQHSYL